MSLSKSHPDSPMSLSKSHPYSLMSDASRHDTTFHPASEVPRFPSKRTSPSDLGSQRLHAVVERSRASSRRQHQQPRPSPAQRPKLRNDLQHVGALLRNNLVDALPPSEDTLGDGPRFGEQTLDVLFYCLGTVPSDLGLLKSRADSRDYPQRAPEGHGQGQTPPGHTGTARSGHRGEDNEILNDADEEKRTSSDHEELVDLESILTLAELVNDHKHSTLKDLLRWDPKITKRLSFVHPKCLNQNLDFVKSTTNIDADILRFVKELTDQFPAPADIGALQTEDGRRRVPQHQNAQRQGSEREAKARAPLSSPTAKLARRQDVHRPKPAPGRSVWLGLDHTLSAPKGKRLDDGRSEAGEGSESTREGGLTILASQYVTKKSKLPQTFSRTDPLPWTCPSNTKWRDLGLHVFPRYVQETFCGENDRGGNRSSTTCWFGFYNCRPSTSAVQVLVRHTGSCNDSRVPQNMRRHYFLSVISINTGCLCL